MRNSLLYKNSAGEKKNFFREIALQDWTRNSIPDCVRLRWHGVPGRLPSLAGGREGDHGVPGQPILCDRPVAPLSTRANQVLTTEH